MASRRIVFVAQAAAEFVLVAPAEAGLVFVVLAAEVLVFVAFAAADSVSVAFVVAGCRAFSPGPAIASADFAEAAAVSARWLPIGPSADPGSVAARLAAAPDPAACVDSRVAADVAAPQPG